MPHESDSIVDINRLVEDVSKRFASIGSNLRVIVNLDGTIPEVRTNGARLTRLLSSAARALLPTRRPPARLTFRTDRDTSMVVAISICGHPDSDVTVDPRLAESVAELDISSDDQKSRIVVRVPLQHQATPPQDVPARGKTILLVDDESLFLTAQSRLLRMNGFNIIAAESGERALNAARLFRDKLEWAIIDLCMPNMPGTVLFDRLRRLVPHLKIIVMTGYAPRRTVEEVRGKGASAVLLKPIDNDALLGLLQT